MPDHPERRNDNVYIFPSLQNVHCAGSRFPFHGGKSFYGRRFLHFVQNAIRHLYVHEATPQDLNRSCHRYKVKAKKQSPMIENPICAVGC